MFYLTTHSTHFILRLYGVGVLRVGHNTRDNGAKVMDWYEQSNTPPLLIHLAWPAAPIAVGGMQIT